MEYKKRHYRLHDKFALCLLIATLPSCAAAPLLIPPTLQWAGSVLKTAASNYGQSSSYVQDLKGLLTNIQTRVGTGGMTMPSGFQMPSDQSSGFQGNAGTMSGTWGTNTPGAFQSVPNQGGFQNPVPQAPQGNIGGTGGISGSINPGSFQTGQSGTPFPSTNPAQVPQSGTPPNTFSQAPQSGVICGPIRGNITVPLPQGCGQDGSIGGSQASTPDVQTTNPGNLVNLGQLPTDRLVLNVSLSRVTFQNGQLIYTPIADGEELRDGRGDPQAGDKYRVIFSTNQKAYVYIIQVDATGWAQPVFPSDNSPYPNPVQPWQNYIVPQDKAYSLDQFRGVENFYFLASPYPRDDIQSFINKVGTRERPASAVAQHVQEAAPVPLSSPLRGNITVPLIAPTGDVQQIRAESYFAIQSGQDLVITKWFNHR